MYKWLGLVKYFLKMREYIHQKGKYLNLEFRDKFVRKKKINFALYIS